MITLYDYWRSSAAYRVRIALNLKALEYRAKPVNLRAGVERSADYRAVNPQGLVPALVTSDGRTLTQSLAIVEYLEETFPKPGLLPGDSAGRARVRALALIVACEIHPPNNLRVLNYLEARLGIAEPARMAWYRHWVTEGLATLEALLASNPATGRYCHGDSPGLADVCLIPQVYNAHRYQCELSAFPTVNRIAEACAALPAFDRARPELQPDAAV